MAFWDRAAVAIETECRTNRLPKKECQLLFMGVGMARQSIAPRQSISANFVPKFPIKAAAPLVE
jgi:hypothetical protein